MYYVEPRPLSNRTCSTRRLAENYALSKLVHGDVFQPDVKTDGAFLGKAVFLRWVSCITERALNTLRYIHGNPKAAKMRHGFFYDFSNYGSYERLTDDGLTQWHPAFLRLGNSLEECAKKYKGFCQKYKPKEKTPTKCHWGSKLLGGVHLEGKSKGSTTHPKKFKSCSPPCQVSENSEQTRVVRQFREANRAPYEVEKEF